MIQFEGFIKSSESMSSNTFIILNSHGYRIADLAIMDMPLVFKIEELFKKKAEKSSEGKSQPVYPVLLPVKFSIELQ